MVPVYLSGAQKHLFFSSLKQLDPNEPDGKHVCSQCNEVVPNLREGRRHMVTHIRVMRLRCSLCGAGSFFCTDLRVHLMEGYCEKLHRAPEGVVNSNRNPCMTKEQADSLSELVDPVNPGRVMYTSGKIVSAKSRISYYPDPIIEERILGPGRVFGRSSPGRMKCGRV
ncbi:zinc finger, C2H2 type [Dictyocaulus viviparus]|uniref:Zinc finger, C2H2 type n=1 Tax=Dictyocaulus viviparus TaxID=29172 RepID=A0A0D8XL29_DICVI|nr:zinc finger, C2H2 type [Dictyocaulus viviparus]